MSDVSPDVGAFPVEGSHSEERQLRWILDNGWEVSELAAVLGVSSRTVSRWRDPGGSGVVGMAARGRVNDLFTVAQIFVRDGTFSISDVVLWSRSRLRLLHYKRPLELIRDGDVERVIAAACVQIRPDQEEYYFGVVAGDPNSHVLMAPAGDDSADGPARVVYKNRPAGSRP